MSYKSDHIKVILSEMCDRVGVKFEDIDFKQPTWYWLHEWTEEQEDSFRDWLIKYMKSNENIFTPSRRRFDAERQANGFVFNYGWRIKQQ